MRRRDVFTRTKQSIIGISFGIVFVSLVILAVFTQFFYRARLFEHVDQQLLTHRNMVLNEKIVKYKGNEKEVILPAPLTPDLISFVWEGDKLVDQSPHTYFGEGMYPEFPANYKGGLITLKSGEYSYRALSFIKDDLKVQLLLNVDSQLQSVQQLETATWVSLLILLGIALCLATYLASVAIKPIKKAYNQQVFFVQDASHEMRTPLAVIKGQLELMSGYRDDQIQEHFEELAQMMNEIRNLERLNSDLLLLTKEDIEGHLNVEKISLNSFIEEFREFYSDLSEIQGKNFVVENEVSTNEADEWVEWDKVKVKRCLTILLENAFKYTPEGGMIKLKVETNNKKIKISVEDTGLGMTKEDLARVFDRFFRSKDVRARGIEGSGIGLSLLKSLAHTMGIQVGVTSVYKEGSTFTLEIPSKMIK